MSRRVFLRHTSELRNFPDDLSFIGAAERAIQRSENVVIDMAYFGATDATSAEVCIERLRTADVYVGVIGLRYGSLVPELDISYTELEFNTATEMGIERLVFLLSDAAAVPPATFVHAATDAKQKAFRDRIKRTLTVDFFENPQGLETQVLAALHTAQAVRPIQTAHSDAFPQSEEVHGRDDDMQAMLKLIAPSKDGKFLLITGEGGIGKSTLVAGIIRRHGNALPNPFWIDLRRAPPAEEIIARLLRLFAGTSNLSPSEQLAALASSIAQSDLTIVLDNFDVVVGADGSVDAGYQLLVDALRQTRPAGAIFLLSRASPAAWTEGHDYLRYRLRGLPASSGASLLESKGVPGSHHEREALSAKVGGSPFWLLQIAALARADNLSAAELLARPSLTTTPGDALLSAQVGKLSTDARTMLSTAAVFRRPVPLRALRFTLDTTPLSEGTALAITHELRERCLLDFLPEARLYDIHPMLREYLIRTTTDHELPHRLATAFWMSSFPVDGSTATFDDVRPIVEAHHHMIQSGRWKEALDLSCEQRLGPGLSLDVTTFLAEKGAGAEALRMEEELVRYADKDDELYPVALNSLGTALLSSVSLDLAADLQRARELFQEAAAAHWQRHEFPQWVVTNINLTNAIGSRPDGDRNVNLQSAATHLRWVIKRIDLVLSEIPLGRVRTVIINERARAYLNLAANLTQLPESDEATMTEALEVAQKAARVLTKERAPDTWIRVAVQIGIAQQALAHIRKGTEQSQLLDDSIQILNDAYQFALENEWPLLASMAGRNQGAAYTRRAQLTESSNDLNAAIALLDECLAIPTVRDDVVERSGALANRAGAYLVLAVQGASDAYVTALSDAEDALKVFSFDFYRDRWMVTVRIKVAALAMTRRSTEALAFIETVAASMGTKPDQAITEELRDLASHLQARGAAD